MSPNTTLIRPPCGWKHGQDLPGLFQPIAADDVAAIVADVALALPRNGIVEIAGPERAPFNEIIARYLKAVGDPRVVVSDPAAGRGAPRPHRLRRMAPPLTGSSLIPHPPTGGKAP